MICWKWSNGSYAKKSLIKDIENNFKHTIEPNNEQQIEFNKREKISDEINNRELLLNSNVNPFFNKNNYINDVYTRDKFLKPVCTSIEK